MPFPVKEAGLLFASDWKGKFEFSVYFIMSRAAFIKVSVGIDKSTIVGDFFYYYYLYISLFILHKRLYKILKTSIIKKYIVWMCRFTSLNQMANLSTILRYECVV